MTAPPFDQGLDIGPLCCSHVALIPVLILSKISSVLQHVCIAWQRIICSTHTALGETYRKMTPWAAAIFYPAHHGHLAPQHNLSPYLSKQVIQQQVILAIWHQQQTAGAHPRAVVAPLWYRNSATPQALLHQILSGQATARVCAGHAAFLGLDEHSADT